MTAELAAEPFDFRAPPRINPQLASTVAALQARFAPSLSALLVSRLRQPCEVAPGESAPLTVSGYSTYCVAPLLRFVCALDGHPGTSKVLALNPELAVHAVGRLFGGGIDNSTARALSPLERSVLRELVERILPRFAEAGNPSLRLASKLVAFADGDAPSIASVGDTLLRVGFMVRCGNTEGSIDFLMPLRVLGDVPADDAGGSERSADDRIACESHVRAVTVSLATRLHLRLPAWQLADLHEGQVLETGRPSHAEVEVSAHGRPLFAGVLGKHHGHVGVRITRHIAPDESLSTVNRKASRA